MSKICRTFAAEMNTIMEKRTYIQPEVETAIYYSQGIMIPNSPTNGEMDPTAPSTPAPGRNVAGPKGVWL